MGNTLLFFIFSFIVLISYFEYIHTYMDQILVLILILVNYESDKLEIQLIGSN